MSKRASSVASWFRGRDPLVELGLEAPRRVGEADAKQAFAEAALGLDLVALSRVAVYFLLEKAELPEDKTLIEGLSGETLVVLAAAVAAKLHSRRDERQSLLQEAAHYAAGTMQANDPKMKAGVPPRAGFANEPEESDVEVSEASPEPRPQPKGGKRVGKAPTATNATTAPPPPPANATPLAAMERLDRIERMMELLVTQAVPPDHEPHRVPAKAPTKARSVRDDDDDDEESSSATREQAAMSVTQPQVWMDVATLASFLDDDSNAALEAEAAARLFFAAQLAERGERGYIAQEHMMLLGSTMRLLARFPDLAGDRDFEAIFRVPLTRLMTYKGRNDGQPQEYAAAFARNALGQTMPEWVQSARKEAALEAKVALTLNTTRRGTSNGRGRGLGRGRGGRGRGRGGRGGANTSPAEN